MRSSQPTPLAWLVRCEQVIAIVLVVTILVTMSMQVVARYLFRMPLPWSEEVARLAMIWLTFISASFVLAQKGHIAVEIGGDGTNADAPQESGDRSRVKPYHLRTILLGWQLRSLVLLLTCLALVLGGLPFMVRVYPVASPGIGASKTFWYGAAGAGFGLMAVHCVADILTRISRFFPSARKPQA